MAGAWDFTATSPSFTGQGGQAFVIGVQANLSEDSSGNLSATGSATANGPTGDVFVVLMAGASLNSITDLQIDTLGNAGCTTDSGTRNMTGTIDSSDKVSLTFDDGGSTVTITGTLNSSANTFSGTFSVSDPGCNNDGITGTVSGVQASSVAGNYAGSPYNDTADNLTFTLTAGSNDTFSGSGTDSQNGGFTLTGNSVGNAFIVTSTPSGGGSSTTLYGYYDPQLGAKGSVLSAFDVPGSTSCANGAPLLGESCLYGIFTRQ